MMESKTLAAALKNKLLDFLRKNKKTDLISTYLYYIENKYHLDPILFPKEKTIYQNLETLTKHLEKEGKLWRETEIKIQFGKQNVNDETKKIYICPFTGKVFGDNTHPNPQDAIYDWVSSCKENTERVDGLPVKRFFVSEDPEVIKNYITPRTSVISKTVYSSVITGKLFNSKEAVIDDFRKNHIKHLTLFEVQNQNKFQIESEFLAFLQNHLTEEKIAAFIEILSTHSEMQPYLRKWLNEEKPEEKDSSVENSESSEVHE